MARKNNSPFDVQIDGLRPLIRQNGRLLQRVLKPKPLLEESVKAYRFEVADNFDTEGGGLPWGRWQPLSSRRARERIKMGYGGYHPILEADGDLRKAAVSINYRGEGAASKTEVDDKAAILTIDGDKVRNQFGFLNEYGYWTPPRQFWPFHDRQHDAIFEPFENWADSWLASTE